MIRLYTLLIISLFAASAFAQSIKQQFTIEKPDLEAIKAATYDRSSPYYYPRLMKEFQRNDTLMKLDKFRHLYFGYMFIWAADLSRVLAPGSPRKLLQLSAWILLTLSKAIQGNSLKFMGLERSGSIK